MKQGMQRQSLYYISILFITLFFSGHQFYKFQKHDLKFSNVGPVYDSMSKIEILTRNTGAKIIKRLVDQGQIKSASTSLLDIDKKTTYISGVTGLSRNEKFSKSINNLKRNVNGILRQSNPKIIYMVLLNKITNFQNIVFQRKWRTLTRLTRIMMTKVKITRSFNTKFFSYKRMRENVNQIQKLIIRMESVTRKSQLSRLDKNLVFTQISLMKPELNLLRKYIFSIKDFRINYTSFSKEYNNWLVRSVANLNKKRVAVSGYSKEINFGLLILISFLLIAIIAGFVLSKVTSRQDTEYFEQKVIDVLDTIVTGKSKKVALNGLSLETRDKIYKYEVFMQKRMNLGDRLTDGIPFSSALFDSNLNLVWGNDLFYDCFKLQKNDYIQNDLNWNYVQNFTDLGESDPLLVALGDDVAGIYQIQLTNNDKVSPFELYVTPIVHNNSRNIHVTLYPLSEIEDTLEHQIDTLISPIIKTIEAISTEQFDQSFREQIAHEFELAGADNIYMKFQSLNENFKSQKHGLLQEVERLENEVYDKIKVINDANHYSSQLTEINESLKSNFKTTKNEVVKVIDNRYEEENLWSELMSESNKFLAYNQTIVSRYSSIFDDTTEMRKTITSLAPVKSELKVLKKNLAEMKGEMLRVLDQELVKNKIAGLDIPEFIGDFKGTFLDFDKISENISTVLMRLDVGVSKLDLLSGNITKSDGVLQKNHDCQNDSKLVAQDFLDRAQQMNIEFQKNIYLGKESDECVIGALKNMYQDIVLNRNKFCEMVSLLNDVSNIESEVSLNIQHSNEALDA